MTRLAHYLPTIEDAHDIHQSIEAGTPWHVSPHAAGERYMQCNTTRSVPNEYMVFEPPKYLTVVAEHWEGGSSKLLQINTIVPPQAPWVKVYGEAAGMPEPALRQPASLQDLAHRALDKSNSKSP